MQWRKREYFNYENTHQLNVSNMPFVFNDRLRRKALFWRSQNTVQTCWKCTPFKNSTTFRQQTNFRILFHPRTQRRTGCRHQATPLIRSLREVNSRGRSLRGRAALLPLKNPPTLGNEQPHVGCAVRTFPVCCLNQTNWCTQRTLRRYNRPWKKQPNFTAAKPKQFT